MAASSYKKTYDESGDYVDDGHFAHDLRSVRLPRLVILGKGDRLVEPPAEAAAYYRREFSVPVVLVPGAGQSPMVEQPEATARLLFGLDRKR